MCSIKFNEDYCVEDEIKLTEAGRLRSIRQFD